MLVLLFAFIYYVHDKYIKTYTLIKGINMRRLFSSNTLTANFLGTRRSLFLRQPKSAYSAQKVYLSSGENSELNSYRSLLDIEIQQQHQRISIHPLWDWFSTRSSMSSKDKMVFLCPKMINLVLAPHQFSHPSVNNKKNKHDGTPFERAIATYVEYDRMHSKSFINDWRKLGVDDVFDCDHSDYIRAMMSNSDQSMNQGYLRIHDMIMKNQHPLSQLAIMQMMALFKKVFLRATEPKATAVTYYDAQTLRYFGAKPITYEVLQHQCETLFFIESSKLSNLAKHQLTEMYDQDYRDPKFRVTVSNNIREIGDIFSIILDAWLSDAEKYTAVSTNHAKNIFSADSSGIIKQIQPAQPKLSGTDSGLSCELEQQFPVEDAIIPDSRFTPAAFFKTKANTTWWPKPLSIYEKNTSDAFYEIPTHAFFSALHQDPAIIPKAIRAMTLIDFLDQSFFAKFFVWDQASNNSCQHAHQLSSVTKDIGIAADAIANDWQLLGFDEHAIGFKTSDILDFKFFSQENRQRRAYSLNWMKILMCEKDPKLRLAMFYMTINVQSQLLLALSKHEHFIVAGTSLKFFNARWHQDFEKKYQSNINEIMATLSASEVILINAMADEMISAIEENLDNDFSLLSPSYSEHYPSI